MREIYCKVNEQPGKDKKIDLLPICEEANKLLVKKYPMLKGEIKYWMCEYMMEAMENLGYKITKVEVKEVKK